MNHKLVNTLAEEVQNTTNEELKSLYANQLFEELTPWIKNQAKKVHSSMKVYNGDYSHIQGCIEDGILRWVMNNDAHEDYDSSKGYFVGFINGHVSNELKKYKSTLTVQSRNIANEGKSLNDSPSEDSENTYGEMLTDNPDYSIGDEVSDSMYVSNLLDEFSLVAKDGENKVQAIKMVMYPDMYDNQDIANVLGYETYTAGARKKVQRIRKEFQDFMSQTA